MESVTTDDDHRPDDSCANTTTAPSYRRRRRKKRGNGGDITSKEVEHDKWYDEPIHFTSSEFVRPPAKRMLESVPHRRTSLPTLLFERERYGRSVSRQPNRIPWKNRMLFDGITHKSIDQNASTPLKKPRCYCNQAMKFNDLRNSAMEAVIGIAPSGCYVVALGNTCEDYTNLQFCGLPSCKNPSSSVDPLLVTIPLRESPTTTVTQSVNGDDDEEIWFHPSPLLCPIRVWLSSDERLGICIYRTIKSLRNHSANVILFPLQSAISRVSTKMIYHQLNLHVPCQSKQDSSPSHDNNLLIRTSFFPNRRSSAKVGGNVRNFGICDTVTNGIVSYLFLVDEDDGFRFVWVHESSWNMKEAQVEYISSFWQPEQNGDDRTTVVRANCDSRVVVEASLVDSEWEQLIADPTTGEFSCCSSDIGPDKSQFVISFTGSLSVISLLLDILTRRPNLVHPRFSACKAILPNFNYHMSQVKEGRIAEVVIMFAVGPVGRGCLGVFVEVDLLTQDYRELQWIQLRTNDTPPSTCSKLLLGRWKASNNAQPNTDCFFSDCEMDCFFPDCVTMDNQAIRRQIPKLVLGARNSPVAITFR